MLKKDEALFQYDHYFKMLSDERRMSAFKKAIFEEVKEGDVVVDIGAGTGILGFWALQAGASKVYCIEKTNAIDLAKSIATHNHFQSSITFLNNNSKEVELPELADVVVSETLGSFAIDESTLDFTIDARKRFLKPNGKLIPRNIEIQYAPVECPEVYAKLNFWNDVYGVDFSPAKVIFSKKMFVESFNKENILALPEVYADIDLYTVDSAEYQSANRFDFHRTGTAHGIAGWFEVELSDNVTLCTSPLRPQTHWKQAFFPFEDPIEVTEEDLLEVSLQVKPQSVDSDNTAIRYDYRCTQLANEN